MGNANMQRLVQADTGEILYAVFPVKPKLQTELFVMTFQESLASLARDPDFNGQSYRVLLWLLARLDYENQIMTNQSGVADSLGMTRPQVSKAFKLLKEKKIILETKVPGQVRAYRLNSHYGWKGKVKNLRAARSAHLKVVTSGGDRA